MDPSPTGLLPVGSFNACYFFMQGSSSDEKAMSECQDVVVSPLGPPQLVYPYDEASAERLLSRARNLIVITVVTGLN